MRFFAFRRPGTGRCTIWYFYSDCFYYIGFRGIILICANPDRSEPVWPRRRTDQLARLTTSTYFGGCFRRHSCDDRGTLTLASTTSHDLYAAVRLQGATMLKEAAVSASPSVFGRDDTVSARWHHLASKACRSTRLALLSRLTFPNGLLLVKRLRVAMMSG